jgi:chromate transporter
MSADVPSSPVVSYRELFGIFLRAGLALGGGPGILAALQEELVSKRQLVSRQDFLSTYALARIVPSGTSMSLAIAYGYRFRGLPGTLLAVGALISPGVLITLLLTLAYTQLQGRPILGVLAVTVIPASLAFIVASAVKLGKDVFRPSFELILALTAFVAVSAFHVHPALVLVGSGVAGAILFGRGAKDRK